MIEPFYNGFYRVIIDDDFCFFINVSLDPYLDSPVMPVKLVAFPDIMEKPVACVECDNLIEFGTHDEHFRMVE
jgi:hypothetical protein